MVALEATFIFIMELVQVLHRLRSGAGVAEPSRPDSPLLKVRTELADGNFVAAAHWLETGFAFSQHIGNGPFLINRLVGIACTNQFEDCLLDFVVEPLFAHS